MSEERDDGMKRLTKLALDKDDWDLVNRWKPTEEPEGRKLVLVGRLQRLLNDRLPQEPNRKGVLTVDGKYGSSTNEALANSVLIGDDLGSELAAVVLDYRTSKAKTSTLAGCNSHESVLQYELDGARSDLVDALKLVEAISYLELDGEDFRLAMEAAKVEAQNAAASYVLAWRAYRGARGELPHKKGATS